MSDTEIEVKETPKAKSRKAPNGEIYSKLIAAMAEMSNAIKDTNGARGKYADLASVYSAIKPALKAHGLGMMQPATTTDSGMVCVETIVFDGKETVSSGELRIPVQSGNIAQAIGSAITYARRYSALSFFCIAADDDDGSAVAGGQPMAIASPELTKRAELAASQGENAYRQFFTGLNASEKEVLIKTGLHRSLKSKLGLTNA